MQNIPQTHIKDIYDSLPDDLQIAIFSPESMDVYDQIRERYALDEHQREELSIQTGLLMMGITEPKEYVLVLAEKLGIPRDKAAFIAQEVNRNILHPVRDSLKEIHAPVREESLPATPSTVSTPTTTPPPAIPPAPASAFDQKLGSSFRVPTPPQASVPDYSAAPIETPVVPPPPVPRPPTPSAPRASDPYREPPL